MAQRLPPGIQGYFAGQELGMRQDAAGLNQLRGILGILAEQEAQAAAREMRPLQMEALRGQVADRQGLARYRDAQIADMERKGVMAQQQQTAQGVLANLLATGGYQGTVAGPTTVALSDEEAIRRVREASEQGRELGANVPSPGSVQGLSVLADPQRAIPELLRQQRPEKPLTPRQMVTPVAGGYLDENRQFVRTAPEPQRVERRDPLVRVMGTDGKPKLVRESEAEGMQPAPMPSGREDNEMIRRTLQFGTAMEKAAFPQSYATLEEATSKIAAAGEEALKFLTGPGAALPDRAVPKEARDARQALQRLLNITLKDRSGAAVTVPEWERFKQEAGVGFFKDPTQIPAWLAQAKTILDKHYAGVAAGFPQDVRDRYFEELGRVAPFGKAGPTAPLGGGGWNDDKERRYQELLRKRGGT